MTRKCGVVETAKAMFLIDSSGYLPERFGVKRLKNFQSLDTAFSRHILGSIEFYCSTFFFPSRSVPRMGSVDEI